MWSSRGTAIALVLAVLCPIFEVNMTARRSAPLLGGWAIIVGAVFLSNSEDDVVDNSKIKKGAFRIIKLHSGTLTITGSENHGRG